MKVVINKCFGGFGLSDIAEDLYAKKKGWKLFRYEQSKYSYKDGNDEYVKVNPESGKKGFIDFTFTKDFGDSFNSFPAGKDNGYWYSHDIDRADKILVEVVEELGEKANGRFSSLEIVEIPDGIEYGIDEYDGIEHIAETHRTWG